MLINQMSFFLIKFESRRMSIVSVHCDKLLLQANVNH